MRAHHRLLTGMVLGCLFLAQRVSFAQTSYASPEGGWLYTYEAGSGDDIAGEAGSGFTSLDGTFSHDNGSDQWDGSRFGADGRPGGAQVIDGFLRMQETGDPRDHGFPDPGSIRKLYFGHDLSGDGASNTLLDDGVTLYFRARVPTTGDDIHVNGGGGIIPYPATGDGYLTHNGGKGTIGIKQASGGLISFVLATAFDDTGELGAAIITNSLNGTAITGDVDFGDGETVALAVDTTEFHEYWITISKPAGELAGTHQLALYADGSLDPIAAEVDLTAGDGSDFDDITYLAFGLGSTNSSGAVDIDYVRVAAGVHAPTAIVLPPVPASTTLGSILLVLCAAGLGVALLIGRKKLAPATS